MTRNLLTLLIAALALAQAMGADSTPPPATQPAVAPDLSKPVWVILQCDTTKPPTLSEEQKKTIGNIVNGPFFRAKFPTGLGFAYDQGTVSRPWFSTLDWYGAGGGPDMRPQSHTPIAFLASGCVMSETVTVAQPTITGERFTVRWQSRYPWEHVKDPVEVSLDLTGTVKGSRLEGTWKGTVAGIACEGTCYGAILPCQVPVLDPANAIYQIVSFGQRLSHMVIVTEVREGKAVAALARSAQGVDLLTAEASDLSVTSDPPDVNGRGAQLKGVLKVPGGFSVDLSTIRLTPTGYGGVLADPKNASSLQIRAYPLNDPIASQWRTWIKASITGAAPVEPSLAEAARLETQTLTCLPGPGQAAQFWHRYPSGWVKTFVYAPWFDFQSVPGAKSYRFTVGKASFDAATPNAWLTPIWKDIDVNQRKGHTVTMTALAGDGTPLGEAQQRTFTKRPAFGAEPMARILTDEALAQELAMRYPRVLAERYFGNIVSLWAEHSAPHDPPSMSAIRTVHDPFATLVRWSQDPVERARAARLAVAWKTHYIPILRQKTFGCTDDYFSFGFVQQTLNDYLTTHEVTGDIRLLDEVRHWANVHCRIIQPNGAWTWINKGSGGGEIAKDPWTPFSSAMGYFGRTTMDHDAAPYVNFLGRLRLFTGDDRHRDTELKGLHALLRNGLRTGYWPSQMQQSDGSDDSITNTMAIETLEYLLERGPATLSRTLAEDLARYIEDRWINWGPLSLIQGGSLTNSGQLPMAINFLRLWRDTGKALYRAKADALFQSYLIIRDPVLGLPGIALDRTQVEPDDPAWALRYLELRRELDRAPKLPPPTLANAVAVLRLQNGVTRAEPLGVHLDMQLQRQKTPTPQPASDALYLHLDVQGGTVRHAIATTPTWDGPILDFPQCGRLHWQDGMALFHRVDATKLTIGPQGLSGDVVVHLKAPMPDRQPVATTFRIDTTLNDRMLSGRHADGQVAGELQAPAATKAERVWFEVDQAVRGGEAWQNWAVAQLDLPGVSPKKDRAPRSLTNGNAGWSATVESSEVALTDTTITGSLRTTVNAFGFRDGLKEDENYQKKAWEQGLSFLAYWNTSEKFFGRKTGGGHKEARYTWHTNPKPLGEHIEYVTTSKPVTPGTYEYRFDGRRLGDVLAGTATVKGPDGTERTCQFLGGVE